MESTEQIKSIYDELVELYGPMIELGELALVLRRSRNGIRNAVAEAEGTNKENAAMWARRLADSKTRVGRKIMFRTRVVANLLDTGEF